MAFITIEQAYALAMGVYFTYNDGTVFTNRGSLTSTGLDTRASTDKKNKLSSLVAVWNNNSNLDLGDITYVNKSTGNTVTLIATANTPSTTYDLVLSTTNQNGGSTMDYLEGSSSIDSTTGTLSDIEANLHKSGRVIFRKLKK